MLVGIFCLAIQNPGVSFAAEQHYDTLGTNICFRLRSVSVDEDYRDNGASLSQFIEDAREIQLDSGKTIKFIVIESFASPSGRVDENVELSEGRARAIRDYITRNVGIDPSMVKVYARGVNWGGMKAAVEDMTESEFPWKIAVLQTMNSYGVPPNPVILDQKKCKADLMMIDSGRAWKWMMANMFENLRIGSGTICYLTAGSYGELESGEASESYGEDGEDYDVEGLEGEEGYEEEEGGEVEEGFEEEEANGEPGIHRESNMTRSRDTENFIISGLVPQPGTVIDSVAIRCIAAAVAEETVRKMLLEYEMARMVIDEEPVWKNESQFKIPQVALRTNLLLPAMNLGLEICEGNRWSTAIDIYYPWVQRDWMNKWTGTDKLNCFQFQSAYLTQYLWLGKNRGRDERYGKYRLRGHALGLVLAAARFDLGIDGKGVQGEAAAAGLEYRFSLPLGKGGVMLGFEIAGGYEVHHEHRYFIGKGNPDGSSAYSDNDYGEKGVKIGQGFTPMKAGISLTIPIANKKRRVEE